jgi:hypothetical protein
MTRAHLLALFVAAAAATVRAPDASAQVTPGLPVWRVDPLPQVTIGALDGPDEYLLTAPQEGMVFGDGTIVIRNSSRGFFELRYYDREGRYITTASRWGQGPFEFRFPNGVMHLPGDSALVVGEDGRYAVFGPRGERVRDGRIAAVPALALGHEFIGADQFGGVTLGPTGGPPTGVVRTPMAFLVQGLNGDVDTLAVLPGEVGYYEREGAVTRTFVAPFTPFVGWGGGGMYWVGQTDVPEVRGYDADSRVRTTIRLRRAPVEVTRADRSRWTDAYVERWSRIPTFDRRSMDRALDQLGFPETLPYWRSLDVDGLGKLWVSRYDVPWAEGPQYWDVFSQSGVAIATAMIPEEIVPPCFRQVRALLCRRIFEIGPDYVLMSDRDTLGVPRVKKYGLVKP